MTLDPAVTAGRPIGSDVSLRRLPEMIRPDYGANTLADLMPSIGAHLGVPGAHDDVIGLPAADRYVVMLVDGLGWHLIRGAVRDAPYLAGLLGEARTLTAGVPSTTVTSLTSLGTGLPPGAHGMVGYTARVPHSHQILNALTWDADVDPQTFQPKATFFERARRSGVAVSSVGLERFADSGLTTAALRGADFVGITDEAATESRVAKIVEAATRTPPAGGPGRTSRSLVYAYERQLDHQGHVRGCGSPEWLQQLRRIDDLCERVRAALPDDVAMIITGDHGMLDVPPGHRILVEDEPDLLVDVAAIAGEGRFRQLYVDDGEAALVAARWADLLGERAWVRRRDDAIDDGWFGPVDPGLRARYGDVLVAMRDDWAVMTRNYPRELSLIGMHGSLTPAEMTVPLFFD